MLHLVRWWSHTVCFPSLQGVWGIPSAAREDSHTQRPDLAAAPCLLTERGGGSSSRAFSEDCHGEAEVGVESHSFTVQQTPSGKRASGSCLHYWIPLALTSVQDLCDVPPQYAVGCTKLYHYIGHFVSLHYNLNFITLPTFCAWVFIGLEVRHKW